MWTRSPCSNAADGFRNSSERVRKAPAERLLVDRAFMLNLTAPEMTVSHRGLRALGTTSARPRSHEECVVNVHDLL